MPWPISPIKGDYNVDNKNTLTDVLHFSLPFAIL